ncbi:His-Xaa-Ser repeat protein HxsA [compost metagenome]
MRVQLKLASLQLYTGIIDGAMGAGTVAALKHFQRLKSLPANGLMTTETLNALGIAAVN